MVRDVADHADLGPITESLKRGQPAWRADRPHTGTTLRVWWDARAPDRIDCLVDCKTLIAARVHERFPDSFATDARRRLTVDLRAERDMGALECVAHLSLAYHRLKPLP